MTEAAVGPNEPVSKGDVLFRLDDTEFTAEVAPLEASLAAADTAWLTAQLEFGVARRDDIIRLTERGASTEFQLQHAVSTIEQLEADLRRKRVEGRS